MKAKLLAALATLKSLAQKLYGFSPLLAGILVGYFGHGVIKLGLDLVGNVVRNILG
jgi:hypothetical protein